MAGWQNWDDLTIAAGTSSGRTVLESVWPYIRTAAADGKWPTKEWPDRLMASVGLDIVRIKSAENPVLKDNEDLQSAILAGEMWAANQFHKGILRFETYDKAVDWILAAVREPPTKMYAADVNAAITADPVISTLGPKADGSGYDDDIWKEMTWTQYVHLHYARSLQLQVKTVVTQALVNYVTGLSKMGTATPQWITSRIRQIKRDTANDDLELHKGVIEKVWDYYGVAYGPASSDWGPLFSYLEDQCKSKGLTRLFITTQQSAGQGCSVITMIGDAMRLCPDFNWCRFDKARLPAERDIAQEVKIWAAQMKAVTDNPWLRFGGAAGETQKMANLGFLAKTLLDKAAGTTSVINYAGLDAGNLTIKHRAWIQRIVNQYISARLEADEKDTAPALAAEGDSYDPGASTVLSVIRPDALKYEVPKASKPKK